MGMGIWLEKGRWGGWVGLVVGVGVVGVEVVDVVVGVVDVVVVDVVVVGVGGVECWCLQYQAQDHGLVLLVGQVELVSEVVTPSFLWTLDPTTLRKRS